MSQHQPARQRRRDMFVKAVLLTACMAGMFPVVSAQESGRGSYVTWQDPKERAFTVHVPRGWKVQGGAVRPSTLLVQAKVEVQSPDGEIFFHMGDHFPIFTEPNALLQMAGIKEGGVYVDPMGYRSPVSRYAPGAKFVTGHLLSGRHEKLKVTREIDRPDLARALPTLGINRFDVGEVEYTFQRQGQTYKGGVLCITEVIRAPGAGFGQWHAWRVCFYEAPAKRTDEGKTALLRMAMTMRINPVWAEAEAKGQRDRSRIVAEMGSAVSQIIHDAYWHRQGVMDSIFKRGSDARRGTVDLFDTHTGEERTGVDHRHNYYWTSARGDLLGTETNTPPSPEHRKLIILP